MSYFIMKSEKNTIKLVIVLSLSLITALTSTIFLSSTTIFAVQGGDKQKFTAQLSCDQQVPPI